MANPATTTTARSLHDLGRGCPPAPRPGARGRLSSGGSGRSRQGSWSREDAVPGIYAGPHGGGGGGSSSRRGSEDEGFVGGFQDGLVDVYLEDGRALGKSHTAYQTMRLWDRAVAAVKRRLGGPHGAADRYRTRTRT